MPKINQLKPATSLANTDIMIADTSTGSDTRKIAYSDLRTQVQNESKSVFALKGEVASDDQVADAVGDWLDTHVTPTGSAVAIDDTLKIQGAAADAKAAGEIIVVNGTSSNGTRVNITTTDTDIELAEMSDVAELKSALNYNKTATPGYILRATNEGTGQEWAPVGTPTDAQTAEAVTNWLDAHPEATTTVQDESLSYKKLIPGTLGFVTPEMFGAKGDGVTDDTDALRRCFVSGNFIIMKGSYKIAASLTFTNVHDICVVGGKIVRDANQTFNTFVGNHAENICFRGITFDGNGNDQTMSYPWPDGSQAAIKIAGQCKNIFVEKCKVINHHYGIFIIGADVENASPSYENTAMNGVIRDCVFHNCEVAVDTYGKGITIHHNMIYGCTGNAVRLEGNYQSDATGDPMEDSNYYTSVAGCDVSGNFFVDNEGADIDVYKNNYGVIISGNTHIHYEQGCKINAGDYSRGIEVFGNVYLGQKSQAIDSNKRAYAYTATVDIYGDVFCHDNELTDVVSGIYTKGGCVIQNNRITRSSISAIVLYEASANARKNIIDGNVIIDHVRAEGAWYGCYAVGINTSNNLVLFTNNIIITTDGRPMYVASGVSVYVKNLVSTAEAGTVTKPSGLYEYSN